MTIDGCEMSETPNGDWIAGIRLEYCRAVVRNCTIKGNGGSGIICDDVSDGSISGCTIIGNSMSGIGAWASNLTISSCIIAENSFFGIDSTMSALEIRYCTVAWNEMSSICPRIGCRAVRCEGECSCTIIGSILWFRQGEPWPWSSDYPSLYCADAEVQYSCIHGWDGALGGVGNIGEYPMFANPGYWADPCNTPEQSWDDIWMQGDYHLKSQGGRWDPNDVRWTKDDVTSPCIDAGDPMTPIGPEPFPNGGIINMGAYGGTAEASKSYFGKAPCEIVMAGDVNGDCVVDYGDFQLMALHWLEWGE
jgi:parallel beta-helix repeat protein